MWSEEGEPWDGRDQTVVFCEGQTVLCGVRKGSRGMVEIKLLCFR